MSRRSNDRTRIRVARRDHWCAACGKAIPKGSEYVRQYVRGGKDMREHRECAADLNEIPPTPPRYRDD